MKTRIMITLCTLVSMLAAMPALANTTALDEKQAFAIATDAYVYGYPLVTMEMTRRVMTNVETPRDMHAPMGQFYLSREYPAATFKDVTAPNADTLYATAWLDLSQEPYVLSLPDHKGRYFLMPMLSGWTDVFAVPGKRTTGTKAQSFAITGPGWKGKLPTGLRQVKAPTNMVWILGRTYCTGTPEDYREVHALQNQYRLVPLSAYGKQFTAAPGRVDPDIDMRTAVREQVNIMEAGGYFKLLAELMKDNPPAKADAAMVAKLKRLGIVPGKEFDPAKLDPAVARAVEQAPKAGLEMIMAHRQEAGKLVNGWTFSLKTGLYGSDYLQRAFITAIGLGANLPQDAVYPVTEVDSSGKPLNGASRYLMHFPNGQTPPVDAFWSLTMYNAEYFFVGNPLNRYTVSPRDELKHNPDGSLDLYIQHESPGADKESNWLPAPVDRFVLMLRCYWPQVPLLNGTWEPPAVQMIK